MLLKPAKFTGEKKLTLNGFVFFWEVGADMKKRGLP